MRCEDIMKRDVECVSPQDTVQTTAARMRDQQVGFLPVCDAKKSILGAVTDRDLAVRVLAAGLPATTRVEQVMSPEVIACRPEDDLRRAEELMTRNHKSRIMCVTEKGVLMGVISLSDVAQAENASRAARTMRGVSEREIRNTTRGPH
jgi:CBS domain-containing protein